jgi:hypothetical protein
LKGYGNKHLKREDARKKRRQRHCVPGGTSFINGKALLLFIYMESRIVYLKLIGINNAGAY